MTNDEKLMQFLLGEAPLEGVWFGEDHPTEKGKFWWRKRIRARLAQPEPEPVAWFTEDHREDKSATTYSKKMAERWREKGWPVTPLYTAPPQREWQGLTAKDLAEIPPSCFEGAIWADAKLREKNG